MKRAAAIGFLEPVYDDSDPTAPPAPSPQTAPSPSIAPSPGLAPAPARYAYLVGRLRGRQITMEEATELFELQQQMVVRARMTALAVANARPIPPPPGSRAPAGAPPAGSLASTVASPDALWETLPALAGALGIFAALLKRSQTGPNEPPPVPPASRPPGPKSRTAP